MVVDKADIPLSQSELASQATAAARISFEANSNESGAGPKNAHNMRQQVVQAARLGVISDAAKAATVLKSDETGEI